MLNMNTKFEFECMLFNCIEPKEYFINPGSFGDDVARWLGGELRLQGIESVSEPEQEDFGWFFTFMVGSTEHCVVIGFQPEDTTNGVRWLGWIERQAGFVGSLFGGRKRGILPEAIDAIDAALRSSPEIKKLQWVDEFDGE